MTDSLTTTNYGLNLIPLGNGAHNGLPWGWLVNGNFDSIDTLLKTLADGLTASIANHGLPAYTTANNGQYATVVSGAVVWATLPVSTTSVLGLVKMATAPDDAANPIAVGTNDPRLSDARTPTTHESTHLPGGTDAIPWTTVNGRGTTAAKPAAASGNAGYLYFDTDLGKLQRSTGTAWDDCEGSGGSGGSSFQQFDPDKLPSSPSSQDDEFDGTTLASKWTTINWSSATVKNVNTSAPSCLYLQGLNTSNTFIGLVQPLPSGAGDFTIYAKVATVNFASSSANMAAALILSDGNTAGSGNQRYIEMVTYSSSMIYPQTGYMTNYSSNTANAGYTSSPIRYLGIRRSGTTYSWGWSPDGILWAWNVVAPSFTPTHFGLGGRFPQSAIGAMAFNFIRYFSSASAVLGGFRTIYGS